MKIIDNLYLIKLLFDVSMCSLYKSQSKKKFKLRIHVNPCDINVVSQLL